MKNLMVRTQTLRSLFVRLSAIVLLAALITGAPFHAAFAATPPFAPSLGTAESFAVLGGSTVTNTGPTIITGDLGLSPGTSVTGFPPGSVIVGTTHVADTVAALAQSATLTAYNDLVGQTCTSGPVGPTDLSGSNLGPGVYCFSSTVGLTGTLTLNAAGDPNAVWVFKIGSTLTTGSGSSVVLINGGQICNVFWQVGTSATLGTNSTFIGDILAQDSITITTGAIVSGRALARSGAVTLDTNKVTTTACAVPLVPTLGKAFSPATIPAGNTSTLTITLSNADPTSAASLTAPLIDTLPSGVTVAAGSQTNTCGGAVTATPGGTTVTLATLGSSIPTIPAGGSCAVTIPVTAPVGGNYINSLAAGALQTSNGNNAAAATATLTVPQPPTAPTLGKAFSPATIDAGGASVSTLTITLSNPNASPANLTADLIDTLPLGVVVATGPQTNGCGPLSNLFASVGGSTVTLTWSGSSIPGMIGTTPGTCTVTVPVTALFGGSYSNSLAAGALQTSNGNSAAPAAATLIVNTPAIGGVTLSKAFSPATINPGGPSTLTITLTNTDLNNAANSVSFTDNLPLGVVVAAGSQTNGCTGTLTANTGTSTVALSGGSISANSFCTVTVPVTAPVAGSYFNTLGTATATLTVSPPSPVTLGKDFNLATINAGGTSLLTITLSNADPTLAASLTAPLIDTLPIGVVVAAGSQTNTCGGAVTATPGGTTVTLASLGDSIPTIPAHSFCTVTVPVTAPVGGSYFNSLAAGALRTNIGINAAPAVATLAVLPIITPGLSLSKTPNPTTYTSVGQVIVYTYVVKNTGDVTLKGPFMVTDDKLGTFQCGTVLSLAPGASVTCTQNYTIKLSDLGNVTSLPTGVTANINTGAWLQGVMSIQDTTITGAGPNVPNGIYPCWCIQARVPNDLHNQPAKLYSTIGGSLPADVAGLPWNKVNYALNHKIRGAGTTDLQFFKDVQTAIWALVGQPTSDFGVSAAAQQMINEANAHRTFVAGPGDVAAVIVYSDGLRIKLGSIQESICEMKPLQAIVNHATGSGNLGTVVVKSGQVKATVNQTLTAPPANIAPKLSKSFTQATIKAGGVSTLTITLSNSNSTVASLTADLTDTLPSGVVVAAGSQTNNCGGKLTANKGGSKVTLASTGSSIPGNGSCKVTVPVTAKYTGSYCNTLPAGALQTDKGSNTTAAVATLTVTK